MTVVLSLIGMAIDIHLRQMVINRTEIEEAQLARAVLEKIARDLRSVVVAIREEQLEVDTDALSTLFGLSYGVDSSLISDEATTETEDSEESTEAEVYGTMPGIYGSLEWIQIDTALLPRGEMYGSRQVRSGASSMPDRLSPSKTVLYYLGDDTGQIPMDDSRYDPDQLVGSLGRSLETTALQYGLFRRQLDRQVSQYAVNEGLETDYEQYDEPLAPEVEWIEFSYFDPTAGSQGDTGDWIDYWDMDEMQTLPKAVRITAGIRRQHFGPSLLTPWSSSGEENATIVYSLIVPLPVTIETTEETTEDTGVR